MLSEFVQAKEASRLCKNRHEKIYHIGRWESHDNGLSKEIIGEQRRLEYYLFYFE